ncbi:S8 family serine peptidase [Thalassomonas sp. RHCl1]|uniref:S8 family peptidase n=1 Tax=Thalassomonas sp. RHCl1 TaxID=2995320 RepID=UPI00248B5B6B|nr:S8 family serine peptidase [Thalassomonas sp. RHCl1]
MKFCKMKRITLRTMISTTALALVLTMTAIIGYHSSPAQVDHLSANKNLPASEHKERSNSYILQGDSLAAMTAQVERVGGKISHQLAIINAIGAQLTPSQLTQITATTQLTAFADATLTTSSFSTSTHIARQTGADQLHQLGITGQGVTIAFIDSGISVKTKKGRFLRLDSQGQERILAQYNAETGNMYFVHKNSDDHGHGSHVAGIALSSVLDENGEYNGMAPDANLVSVRAFDENGQGTYLKVINGLDWLVANKDTYNIKVLNLSFGALPRSYYWNDPLNQAVMRAWQAGIVVVTSAGNLGPDPMTVSVPGNVPYVITVGALTDHYTPDDQSDDRITTFSAAGPTHAGFIKPDLIAWGGHMMGKIHDTYLPTLAQQHPEAILGQSYFEISGTSQASAVVAGTVALMLQNDPGLSPDDVKCRLMTSAQMAIAADGKAAYSPFTQGAGKVNAWGAVQSTASGCANNGLDIAADLDGNQHFQGPARVDEHDNFYLLDADGNIWNEGSMWNEGSFWNEGTVWNEGSLWNEGSVWNEGSLWNEGSVWNEGGIWNEGSVWNEGVIWNEGSVWNEGLSDNIDVNAWVDQE